MTLNIIQIARYTLGLSWIYHGLFPKLLFVAPLEKKLTATLGFADDVSFLITKVAGVTEIIIGLLLILFYKNRPFIVFNIFALLSLCLFVAIQLPSLLFEAFNPVTTNFALITLSLVLYKDA